MKFIIDAHLDLSMNAMEWNRDLMHEVSYIRKSEAGLKDFPDREKNTVSFPAMRKGNIGICVATLIARYVKPDNPLPGWNSPEQAWAQTQAQLAWYRAMEKDGRLVQLKSAAALNQHSENWQQEKEMPLGYRRQAAHLAGGAFDHGLAQTDLAVTCDDHLARFFHADDCGAMPPGKFVV